MKKFLPYILILTIIVQILAPFDFGIGGKNLETQKVEAADCEINTAALAQNEDQSETTFTVQTKNCTGRRMNFLIQEGNDVVYSSTDYTIVTDIFNIILKTGNETCRGKRCDNVYGSIDIIKNESRPNDLLSKTTDSIQYYCGGSDETIECKDSRKDWDVSSIKGLRETANYSGCKVLSTSFSPDTSTSKKDKTPSELKVEIETENCTGKTLSSIQVMARENTVFGGASDEKIQGLIADNNVVLSFTAGEETCGGKACDNISMKFTISDSQYASYNTDSISYYCRDSDKGCSKDLKWEFNNDASTGIDTEGATQDITQYYYEVTYKGAATPVKSELFSNEKSCKKSRDATATKYKDAQVSECKPEVVKQEAGVSDGSVSSLLPACNPVGGTWLTGEGSFMGCVVQLFYYVGFVPTSWIFGFSGVMLDSTMYYSIKDSSYRSTFVTEGWKIVRDFCNIFFIFVLLYIAFGTILKMHGIKTQEMIVNVVIIGLLINFSLFATQVIIDASNILTRVFYNADSMEAKDSTGKVKTGENGEISISEAIVSNLNPQKIIMEGQSKISVIGANGENTSGATINNDSGVGIGSWIILILMSTIVNIVGTITFISSSLIFIVRVIGLWLAMILAPIAFFSYIVPQLSGVKMIGWKHWWSDTLKMAFLAPVFTFFIYIIVKFLDVGLGLTQASIKGTSGLAYFVYMIVPFVFIMILMMKAKDIAKNMAGEMGATAVKIGSSIAGLATGAGMGAAAFAMRGTIGAMASRIGESDWAKTHGRVGRIIGDAGKWTAGKSFDFRNTSMGKDAAKELGIGSSVSSGVVKPRDGGYTKYKHGIEEKRRARAESLKLGHNTHAVHKLHGAEEELKALKNMSVNDFSRIEGLLPVKRADRDDKKAKLTAINEKLNRKDYVATAEDLAERDRREKAFEEAQAVVDDLLAEKDELTNATGRYADRTSDGKVNKAAIKGINEKAEKTAEQAEKDRIAFESLGTKDEAVTMAQRNATAELEQAQREAAEANEKAIQGFEKAKEELSKLKDSYGRPLADNHPTRIAAEQKVSMAEKNMREVEEKGATNIASKTISPDRVAKMAENNWDEKQRIYNVSRTKAEEAQAVKTKMENKVASDGGEYSKMEKVKDGSGKVVLDEQGREKESVRSLNHLEFNVVPNTHLEVDTENTRRMNEYADNTKKRWFNRRANEHAAHEIKMQSEIKKH